MSASTFLDEFEKLANQLELYACPNKNRQKSHQKLLRRLYNRIREQSGYQTPFYNETALSALCINDMDEDGIWQQLEAENRFFMKKFATLFCEDETLPESSKADERIFEQSTAGFSDTDEEEEEEDESDDEKISDMEAEFENQKKSSSAFEDEDDELDDELDEETKQISRRHGLDSKEGDNSDDDTLFRSGLDEKTLARKLNSMHGQSDDEEANEDGDDEDDETRDLNGYHESDDEQQDNEQEDDQDSDSELDESLTAYEKQEAKKRKQIAKLEAENLREKPWQLKGETNATSRPQNSLLEEYVEFESGRRAAPIITEEISKQLEKIILDRIRDRKFNDVERKMRTEEQPFEYKRRLLLDSEKSKVGLAQLYENEFLRLRQAGRDKQETPAQREIRDNLRHLFLQLDALCNQNYTPKLASSEIKIVNNLPAIAAEEAIPEAVSLAQQIAPQEVLKPAQKDADLKEYTERNRTDRLRDRRQKKKTLRNKAAGRTELSKRIQGKQRQQISLGRGIKDIRDINQTPNSSKTRKGDQSKTSKSDEGQKIQSIFMKGRK